MEPRVLSFAIARQDTSVTPIGADVSRLSPRAPIDRPNDDHEHQMPPDAQTANPTDSSTEVSPDDTRVEASPTPTLSTLTPLGEVQTLAEAVPEQEKQPTPSGYRTAY